MINVHVRSICSCSRYRLYTMIISLNQLLCGLKKSLDLLNFNMGYVFVLWFVKLHV